MEKTFNDMITRLEQIVATLEKGECTLEESMALFEEGTALAKQCNLKLTAAEQKITQLTDTEKAVD